MERRLDFDLLPLFTDFFVLKKDSGEHIGGCFADDFKPFSAAKIEHKELKILSKISLSPFVKNRVNTISDIMNGLCPDITIDDEFMFVVLPIIYASMKINELEEALVDPQNGMQISKDLKYDLRHILGDI